MKGITVKSLIALRPNCITADAGYGSEENYQHLEDENIEGFIKYSYFDKQQSESLTPDIRLLLEI